MTVGKKMHQTLSSLRSAKADAESFALETDDKMTQKMFTEVSEELGNIINKIQGRVNYIEAQEPQYKVKEQMKNQPQQQ